MQFQITGLKSDGSILSLTLDAVDAHQAQAQAGADGMRVLSVRAKRGWQLGGGRGGKFPLLLFSQELLALLNAGINLVEAIETLAEKEERAETKTVLLELMARLREGLPFSVALEQTPSAFPTLFCATVHASERTGGLAEALGRYVAYQNQLEAVRKRLVSAAIYPVVLIVVGFLVVAFLLVYVVPRFSQVYAEMGENLPWLSRMLMNWGGFIEKQGLLAFTLLGVAGALAWYTARRPATQRRLAAALWRVPAVGKRMRVYQLARFYRTMGMLLRGGMAAAPSMRMVANLLHAGMREQLERALTLIREGRSISQAMESERLVTPVALRMLRVGERTGRMDEMMEKIAEFHDEEMARWIDWFSKLFEPILMAVIGIMIGVIVLLMYMPIFDLAGNLQ
ncbi:MAG TPA: type II secretion system F family protein [Burkholderiales bacterium]|nr:type II secretion system F family protein [Burkholderiales bacterium]